MKSRCISDELDKLCIYYMGVGVPCEEFWNGDYTRFHFYVENHHHAVEQQNYGYWLQGRYFLDALSVVVSNAIGKGSSKIKYPEEPYKIQPNTEEEQEEENKRKVDNTRSALEMLIQRSKSRNKQGGDQSGFGNKS